MPKVVDYAGRFAFFELASFTLVRDHGVDALSRHTVCHRTTSKRAIIPWSSWSSMWQWIMKAPV